MTLVIPSDESLRPEDLRLRLYYNFRKLDLDLLLKEIFSGTLEGLLVVIVLLICSLLELADLDKAVQFLTKVLVMCI